MATKAQALNHCGRLKKGYKFRKGGKIYKVRAKKGAAKKRRRGSQGSLF